MNMNLVILILYYNDIKKFKKIFVINSYYSLMIHLCRGLQLGAIIIFDHNFYIVDLLYINC